METFLRQLRSFFPAGVVPQELLIKIMKAEGSIMFSETDIDLLLAQHLPDPVPLEQLADFLFTDPGQTSEVCCAVAVCCERVVEELIELPRVVIEEELCKLQARYDLIKKEREPKEEPKESDLDDLPFQDLGPKQNPDDSMKYHLDEDGTHLINYIERYDVRFVSTRWLARFIEERLGWDLFISLGSDATHHNAMELIYRDMKEALSPLLLRSQDLATVAPDALWDRAALKQHIRTGEFYALSYAWEAGANPDPFCHVAFAIVRYFYREYVTEPPPRDCQDFALFWDHKSLAQHLIHPMWSGKHPDVSDDKRNQRIYPGAFLEPRTESLDLDFRGAVKHMHIMYHHPKSYVVVYPHLPKDDFIERWNNAASGWGPYHLNRRPYSERGWPALEILGGMCNGRISFLADFEDARIGPKSVWVCSIRDGSEQLALCDKAHLMTPDKFKHFITRKTFTSGADQEIVIENYRMGFNQLMGLNTWTCVNAMSLVTPEILDDVVEALAQSERLEYLALFYWDFELSPIGPRWFARLMTSLAAVGQRPRIKMYSTGNYGRKFMEKIEFDFDDWEKHVGLPEARLEEAPVEEASRRRELTDG